MSLEKIIFKNKGKHSGYSKHPLYSTWTAMLNRCYNEENPAYVNYGGRGVTVTPDWFVFENFMTDMGEKPHGSYSLDRVNNDLGYSKYNCRWATRSQQSDNRRMFTNNTSGGRGVRKTNFGYKAVYDYANTRYQIGNFITFEEAVEARRAFVTMYHIDKEQAIKSISDETVWNNSKTKVRGVTPHIDGGYIVRVTIDGKRWYLGYAQTISEGEQIRKTFMDMYRIDKKLALSKLKIEKPRITSKTKSVGITPSREGFIARVSINGKRYYVGYFKTLEEAIDARTKYIAEKTC